MNYFGQDISSCSASTGITIEGKSNICSIFFFLPLRAIVKTHRRIFANTVSSRVNIPTKFSSIFSTENCIAYHR